MLVSVVCYELTDVIAVVYCNKLDFKGRY